MTTTDVYGYNEYLDGTLDPIGATNLTDGAAAAEVKVCDLAGANGQSLKDRARGKTIGRIVVAVCDGSILTQFGVKKNGVYVYHTYGGERLANGPQAANLDVWDLAIEVDDTTLLYAVTDD